MGNAIVDTSRAGGKSTKANGKGLSFAPNSWHTVELQIGESYYAALFDALAAQVARGAEEYRLHELGKTARAFAAAGHEEASKRRCHVTTQS